MEVYKRSFSRQPPLKKLRRYQGRVRGESKRITRNRVIRRRIEKVQ